MTKKKQTTLKFDEVKTILGVADRTLKNWKKQDASFPVVKIGRLLHYDPVQLKDWLVKNDRADYAAKLNAWMKTRPEFQEKKPSTRKKTAGKKKPGVKPKTAAQKKKEETAADPHTFDFKFRFDRNKPVDVFSAKEMAGELIKRIVNSLDGADLLDVGVLMKNLNTMAEGFRKLELSCIEVDTVLGNVVPMDDVRRYHGEMITRMKTDLRALPHAVADDLATMKSPEKIAQLLIKRIDDALRHLAKDITSDGITSGNKRNK